MEIEVGFLPFIQEMGRVAQNEKFYPPEELHFASYILEFVITSASMLRDCKHKMKNAAGEKKRHSSFTCLSHLALSRKKQNDCETTFSIIGMIFNRNQSIPMGPFMLCSSSVFQTG